MITSVTIFYWCSDTIAGFEIVILRRECDSSVVGALVSGARGPRFDPREDDTLSLETFAGMALNKCAVLRIGTITRCPLCKKSHTL